MEPFSDWIKQLNISEEDLASWKMEAPEDIPLLVWALKEGKLSFRDYSSWAKNHYGLPVVQEEFFSHYTPISTEVSEWSPWMIPLAQWEDLTYIGCVMPPSHPEEGFVYLLANPKDLEKTYRLLETPAEAEESPLIFPESPTGLILNLPDFAPPIPSSEETPQEEEEIVEEQAFESPTVLSALLELPDLSEKETSPSIPFSEEVTAPKAEIKQNLSALLSQWWEECSKRFAHGILLEITDSSFIPFWKNGQNIQGPELSASSPSLFRIALRTQKPYHGFVVENEIHSSFFKSLELTGYPATVTAIYLHNKQNWILILYGHLESGEELKTAEELSASLSEKIGGKPAKAA